MKTYLLKNIITGEIYGKVSCSGLASAQEYFDILFPYKLNAMIFEVK